mgnify:FL=1
MYEKTVTKLWQGKYCSVRDYEVKKAIRKGGMVLYHNGRKMILQADELRQLKPKGNVIQSNYKGSYQLVDILFEPVARDHNQDNLF